MIIYCALKFYATATLAPKGDIYDMHNMLLSV